MLRKQTFTTPNTSVARKQYHSLKRTTSVSESFIPAKSMLHELYATEIRLGTRLTMSTGNISDAGSGLSKSLNPRWLVSIQQRLCIVNADVYAAYTLGTMDGRSKFTMRHVRDVIHLFVQTASERGNATKEA